MMDTALNTSQVHSSQIPAAQTAVNDVPTASEGLRFKDALEAHRTATQSAASPASKLRV